MTNKALYWIALGVFALGVNNEYQKGNLPLAHRVVNRVESFYCHVATSAEQTLALVRVLSGEREFRVDEEVLARQQAEVDRVMAEHQAEIARAMAMREADMDRIQRKLDNVHIVLDRAEMTKLRALERTRFKINTTSRRFVVCPQTGTRIVVDSAPDIADTDDVENEQ